jgi:hypothetical protein
MPRPSVHIFCDSHYQEFRLSAKIDYVSVICLLVHAGLFFIKIWLITSFCRTLSTCRSFVLSCSSAHNKTASETSSRKMQLTEVYGSVHCNSLISSPPFSPPPWSEHTLEMKWSTRPVLTGVLAGNFQESKGRGIRERRNSSAA